MRCNVQVFAHQIHAGIGRMEYIALLLVVVIVAVFYESTIRNEKSKRFSNRNSMSNHDFYLMYYSNTNISVDDINYADKIVHESIGIRIGLCRPDDKITVVLSDINTIPDGGLLDFESELEILAQQCNKKIQSYPVTINEYILLIHELLNIKES